MNRNPCRGCENRSALCHSDCDIYKAWKMEHDTYKAELRDFKEKQHLTYTPAREKKWGRAN